MIRLFVALDLPDGIKDILKPLCQGIPGARWVPEDQLHLTLRFIGEVDGRMFRDIQEVLGDIRQQSFSICLKGLGHFPPRKTPRVLWVGIDPSLEVAGLRNKIEAKLVRTGIEGEKRKFSPHITLARLKDTPITRLTNFLAGNSLFVTDTFQVEEFHLYSSVLTPKGAIHNIEASYPLS